MTREAKGAIHLAIRALKAVHVLKDRKESLSNLDAAIRFLADAVFLEDIHPMDHGITLEVVPVIIQLKLCSRSIQLSKGSSR